VVISASWRHRIHPEMPPPYRPTARLHVGLAFQYQQVAPVDVIPGARQVRRHLLIGLDGAICQVASSHPPGVAAAVPPHVAEFVLFVLFFDFGRRRGLRERQRQRVCVVGRGLAAPLHVSFRGGSDRLPIRTGTAR
jgi:hypothetical protein